MNRDYWEFIHDNSAADIAKLRLSIGSSCKNFCVDDAILQIEARHKAAKKIPWFISHPHFRFPSLQASEQATNQAVALYHASIAGYGRRIADLTSGLGIDSMTLALHGNQVEAFEMDRHRAEVLEDNIRECGVTSCHACCADSIQYLKDNPDRQFDALFIDPARRDVAGNRIFRLQDSLPDVIGNMDLLLQHAPEILIKASPLLDITQTLRDLRGYPCHIHIVSYRGEVKEILILLSGKIDDNRIKIADIADATDFPEGDVMINYQFICRISDGGEVRTAATDEIVSGRYLYEAGAGMRKLHCAAAVCEAYPDMKALSTDAWLFVSDTLYKNFPGRVNIINGVLSGKEAGRLKGEHIRVVSCHYPAAADTVRAKYKLREGNDITLYAAKLAGNKKILILAQKA